MNRFVDNLNSAKGRVSAATKLAGAQSLPDNLDTKIEKLYRLVSNLQAAKEVVKVEVPKTEVVTTEVIKEVEVVKEVAVNLEELEETLKEITEAIAAVDLVVDNSKLEQELSAITEQLSRIEAEKVEITLDPSVVKEELLNLKDHSDVNLRLDNLLTAVSSIEIPQPQELVLPEQAPGITQGEVIDIVTNSAARILEELRTMRGSYSMMVVRDNTDKITRIDVSPEI